MLKPIGQDLWHVQHRFIAMGFLRAISRMTVARLSGNKLWLHSPVPITPAVRAQLETIGDVAYIVAPNKFHHLYFRACAEAFPTAAAFGAPGLAAKLRDPQIRELPGLAELGWEDELEYVVVEGIPVLNETVWFHRPSRTVIFTDFCQYVTGKLPMSAHLYTSLIGVRGHLAVPHTVRMAVKDRAALSRSVRKILQWNVERVVLAHNTIIEQDACDAVKAALAPVM